MTKVEWFTILKEIVKQSNYEDIAGACAFLDKEINIICGKADRARLKANEKKIKGDALRAEIAALLTDEPQNLYEIDAQINKEKFPDTTIGKIAARLAQLINLGIAEKGILTDGDKKCIAYRRNQN